MIKVKLTKLNPDAVIPSYAYTGDAGVDLVAITDGKLVYSEEPGNIFYYVEYETGLSLKIPEGHVGLLFPRSSISQTGMTLANCVGVIDSNYVGEIKVRFKVDTGLVNNLQNFNDLKIYKRGDRIVQLLILPINKIEFEEVADLENTERGERGFGSSEKTT